MTAFYNLDMRRPPRIVAAAAHSLLFLILSGMIPGRTQAQPAFPDVPARFEARVAGNGLLTDLRGVRAIDTDSTGRVLILDGEARRVYSIQDGRVDASFGQGATARDRFDKAPSFMSVTPGGVLITTGGNHSRSAFYDRTLRRTDEIDLPHPVSQAVPWGADRVIVSDLSQVGRLKLYERDGTPLGMVDLANGGDPAMDHFLMDVMRTDDDRDLVILTYNARNRTQVVDPVARKVIADFSMPDMPDIAETEENPAYNEDLDDELPGRMPRYLPRKFLFQSVSVRNGRIYVLARDYTDNRLQDVYVYGIDGTYEGRIILPSPASVIHVGPDEKIYATDKKGTTVSRYRVPRLNEAM